MISIIIPVHNQADQIQACFDSILKQTNNDWELIVVDDGSTDNIKDVVSNYTDYFSEHSFQFFSKQNEGSNPTRNYGFERSVGDYVIFCDADIIMKPQMLETMLQALNEHPDKSFAFSSFMYGAKLFALFPYDEIRLKTMPYIHVGSLIRRKDFPGFDTAINRFQDWDLWLTMLEQGYQGIYINQVLFTTQLGRAHFSSWLPKITYKILPFLPVVKKYKAAMEKIKIKHHLQ